MKKVLRFLASDAKILAGIISLLCLFGISQLASAAVGDTLAIRAFYVENYSYGPLDQDAGSGFSLPPSNFAWRTNKTTHTIMFGGSGSGGTFTQTSPYWAAAGPTADSAALICGITGQPFWRWWRDSTHANGGYLIQSFQAVGSSNFDFVAGDSARTETFWRSFIMWAIRNEVDGCDLDAESSTQSVANRTRFFRIGRRLGYNATWQSYIASTGKPGFRRDGKMIIGNALYMQSTDWMSSTADSTIDFFDLQAYNYQNMWGGSGNRPWYQTPWGVPAGQACGTCEAQGLGYGYTSHKNLIQEWVDAGWSRKKIVVGFDPGAVTVYTGTSAMGTGTPSGTQTDWARQDFEALTSHGGTRTYNAVAMAPYISGTATGGGLSGPFVGSYTDSVSLKAIADVLYQSGAGGIMVYAIAKDVATLGNGSNHALDYYRTPTISGGFYRAWQLNGGGSAPPPAPTAPTATTSAASSVTQTSATLNGSVSANGASTTVRFVWGKVSGVYTDSALAAQSPIGSGSAGVSLATSGLTAGTNYYYRVRAYNSVGNVQGSEVTFATSAASSSAPTATTNAATSIAQTTATVNGTVNANSLSTTVRFVYGKVSGVYTDSVVAAQSPVSGTANTSVSGGLTSLTAGTIYFVRVRAYSSGGNVQGGELSFTTTIAVSAPIVTTSAATSVVQTTATVNGTVNANGASTTVRFVYGTVSGVYTDSAVATQSPIASGSSTVSKGLTALNPGTTYYVRVRAYNSAGGVQGSEVSFATTVAGQGPQDVTSQGTPIALITGPTGEGNHDIEITRDGVMPPVGGTDVLQQYDTFTGGAARTLDWIGSQFATTMSFTGITYQEGLDNQWGGCFVAIQVQVRSAGVWNNVQNLVSSPAYAGSNLINYETYQLSFNPVSGDAIRIAGTPTGSAQYIGVGELRIFASQSTSQPPTATTGAATSISQTTATVNGTVNANGTSTIVRFVYGKVSGTYTDSVVAVQSPVSGTANTAVSGSLTGLTVGTTYYVRVRAYNSAGNVQGSEVTFATSAPSSSAPTASTSATTSITQTTATFNGAVNANGASTTVRFVYGTVSGSYSDSVVAAQSPVSGSSTTSVSSAITGLVAARTYFVRIRAYNAAGNVQGSEVSFTTSLPGGQGPQDITAQGNPIALITAPTGEGNHDIEVIRDGVTPSVGSSDVTQQYDTFTGGAARSFDWIGFQFATTTSFSGITYQEGLDNQWGGCFTTIQVQVRSGGVWSDVQSLVSSPSYAGSNLVNYETYELSFNAISGDAIRIAGAPTGSAQYIGVGELRIFGSQGTGTTPPATQLVSPTNAVTNQPVSSSLRWRVSSGATSYHVQVSTSSAFTTTIVNDSSVVDTVRQVSGLANQTKYYWRVRAKNAAGYSAYTSTWNFTTVPAPPVAPLASSPSNNATGQSLTPTVRWSQSGTVTSYHVQVSTNSAFTTTIFNDSAVTTKYRRVSGLANSTKYYWRVRAKNAAGYGAFCGTWAFTTKTATARVSLTGTPLAFVVQPIGGGNPSLEVMRDGVIPELGDSSRINQFDTYDGTTHQFDWVGYTFDATHQFSNVEFTEGMESDSGGWFASLNVQVRVNGNWVNVQNLTTTPEYEPNNGLNFELYDINFDPINGDGVRIAGTPGGLNTYVSVAELTVMDGDSMLTGVLTTSETPNTFVLDQNYPNPFNPSTMISFVVPTEGHVSLTIYNMLGQKVAELVDGSMSAGKHTVEFSGNNLADGVYMYVLKAGSLSDMKKMMLLK